MATEGAIRVPKLHTISVEVPPLERDAYSEPAFRVVLKEIIACPRIALKVTPENWMGKGDGSDGEGRKDA